MTDILIEHKVLVAQLCRIKHADTVASGALLTATDPELDALATALMESNRVQVIPTFGDMEAVERKPKKPRRVGVARHGTPYDAGLEAIRKDYKAHLRNRGGKWYLTVYWELPKKQIREGYMTYQYVCKLVESHWPKAYCTSFSSMGDGTFRLNP